MTALAERYILIVRCPDRKGIVAAVAGYLAEHDASIVESNHFNDEIADQFYMRTVFRRDGPNFPDADGIRAGLEPIARRFGMEWQLYDALEKPRLLIAVSKFGHCLYDLLHRWRAGILPIEIPAVVSNHEDMRSFVEWSGIPYHYLPVTSDNRQAQEEKLLTLVKDLDIQLVVLARYMQVLLPSTCERLKGRCINIHHSFLPSFRGARPYHQAYARGVKIVGATAHYVTDALDEGPIIEQDIVRVDHSYTPQDLVEHGRDVECRVLARAVSWHIERRVIVAGGKTIVFA